jgi:3-phenylpropionate/trans-cinnamate dioxygenase ferredoxin reductase subunit
VSVVIIGGGLAAAQVAIQLRQRRFAGPITLLSAEPDAPYWKPPLSKSVLQGTEEPEAALIRPTEFWARRKIDLRLGTAVADLDPAAKVITTSSGETFLYEHAVLATGAAPVMPPLPGIDLAGVHVLRSLRDTLALRDACRPGKRVAVLGGGFIGLEAAAALSARGAQVSVIEREPRLLARVAAPEISACLLELHQGQGVRVILGTAARRATGADRVSAVELDNGEAIACDLLLVCVGIRPETRLAERAGLNCQDGILTEFSLRTADPSIFALGDCARFPSHRYGRLLRLESIQNATDGAAAVAAAILGEEASYDPLPMISSLQFGHSLDFIGSAEGCDDTRVARRGKEIVVLQSRMGQCVAATCMNAASEILAQLRQAISDGMRTECLDGKMTFEYAAYEISGWQGDYLLEA